MRSMPDFADPPRFSGSPPFRYRADVLVHLARHGVFPTERTSPQLVRDFLRDLYKYEIRKLREAMLCDAFPKAEYYGRVEALRQRYPVLSLLPRQFVE
jgi:hypothetical protein